MAIFNPAEILLPRVDDLGRWAVVACDQFTSEPQYWQRAEALVGDAPSTLRIILPEVYLEGPEVEKRTADIHQAMRDYLESTLSRSVHGMVYVERTMDSGAVRQGLVGTVDLEEYSYEPGATSRIRPSENTVIERIPPRLAVRREAALESPHILMLIDDAARTVIEPLATKKKKLASLYDQELMLGGHRVRGWAVTDPADIEGVLAAIDALDEPQAFAARYSAEQAAPFAMAVGDGNHSLAAAKARWEELKLSLGQSEWEGHPARYCLVELENIQSEAIEIESIHRVIFDADPSSLLKAAAAFAATFGEELRPAEKEPMPAGVQLFRILYPDGETSFTVHNAPWPLAAGTFEAFMAEYISKRPAVRVDYIHGEDSVAQLVKQGAVGVLLPPFEKGDLFRGVALGGVLPKKTFSMGHANEKRYYLECRKIQK